MKEKILTWIETQEEKLFRILGGILATALLCIPIYIMAMAIYLIIDRLQR